MSTDIKESHRDVTYSLYVRSTRQLGTSMGKSTSLQPSAVEVDNEGEAAKSSQNFQSFPMLKKRSMSHFEKTTLVKILMLVIACGLFQKPL